MTVEECDFLAFSRGDRNRCHPGQYMSTFVSLKKSEGRRNKIKAAKI